MKNISTCQMKIPFCFFQNLILIGMPSSGKTFLGKYLGNQCNIPVIDTDALIDMNPPKTKWDWYMFRKQEQKIITELMNKEPYPKIICTGGGCIDNHHIFSMFLNRPKETILLHIISHQYQDQNKTLPDTYENLWMKRGKYYFQVADFNFWNDGDAEQIVTWYQNTLK